MDKPFSIYLIINESENKTYIGFTDDIERRIIEHLSGKVRTTKEYGDFKYFVLEEAPGRKQARQRERYWKSCAGRKKIKALFFS